MLFRSINQTLHLIEHMGGKLEISDSDKLIKLEIEIPFLARDSSQELITENEINVFRYDRINEYTKKWTSEIGFNDCSVSPYIKKRTPLISRRTADKAFGDDHVTRAKTKIAVNKIKKAESSLQDPIPSATSGQAIKEGLLLRLRESPTCDPKSLQNSIRRKASPSEMVSESHPGLH